ncbi:unnamed protein product [Alopecurus aequalis]
MGSCVSRSPASAASAGRRVATAKVVNIDGSMSQYPVPVTACEALGDTARTSSFFMCSSDELRFDAPTRALADEEALQPGWLYFVLPVSMLHLALSGNEMAALAVRASCALTVAGGVSSPPRRKNVARVTGAHGRQWKTARVAPLVFADDDAEADSGWSRHANGKYVVVHKTVHGRGDETVAKSRKRAGYRSRGIRRRAGTPKLSPILEADEF